MNLLLPILALTPGCKKAVEAPQNLEELVVFGFVHFDDEDVEVLEVTQANLIPEVNAHEDEMADGYLVNSLTAADLEAVGVVDPNVTEIVGALGVVEYRHSLEEVLAPITAENKDEMFDNFLEFEVLEQGDRDCFLSGECERLDQTVREKTQIDMLGEAERVYTNSLRWLDGEDLPRGVMIRQLNPDPVEFEGSLLNMTVFQQYSFVLIYDEGGHARRVETFWVDFELVGMNPPDNMAVSNAVKQMGTQAEKIDTWLDEN
jgi:hypothetical protein